MDIDLIEQFTVFVICCINNAEHTLQDSHIGKFLFFDAGKIKHQCDIADAIRLYIVVHHLHAVDFFFIIVNRRDFSGDVLSVKHRDLLQIFRCRLFLLILFQLFRILYKFLYLFR